jgi:cyclophilin family peptidyl-prolyl cis-trans isomerase
MKAAAIVCAALLIALQGTARRPGSPADATVVLMAERQWAGPEILLPLAASPDRETSRRAIRALGRLRYLDPQDVARAERILARLLTRTIADERLRAVRAAALRSLESLARVNPKLVAFDAATTGTLALIVARTSPNDTPEVRLYALMVLIAARALEKPSLDLALTDEDEQVRRVAMAALAGNAVAVDEAERAELIAHGLESRSVLVRNESLRGYVRRVARTRGCGPLLDAFRDPALHVVLAAIDALGDLCKEDDDVIARIAAEARTPPTLGSWHREAHALVALAKRSPERAAISIPAFRTQSVWQVRMYAARAAAAMKDVVSLERLAYDEDDNVREAALAPLQHIESAEGERALVAALRRRDYQLLRSAALLLKDMPAEHRLFAPLLDALLRVTRDRSETSRDTRAALLDAMAVHGARQDASELVVLLRDFDPAIATHAADLIARWKGETVVPEPQPFARVPAVEPTALSCVRLLLRNGRAFRLTMDAASAPITVGHFLALAMRDHYYDGLTFHRIVPNCIVQGGSPGANEYSGQKESMRDEIAAINARGTVGLSTRGRNTGDAQFYINLVDNPRLDYDYTIFGRVFGPDMRVVDDIQEGDAIARVTPATCR